METLAKTTVFGAYSPALLEAFSSTITESLFVELKQVAPFA